MELSIFVARVIAILYLCVGVGMLVNKNYYKKFYHDFFNEMAAVYIGGFMAVLAGFALVSYHNLWMANWTILVTLIGWLALIKGIFILLLPESFKTLGKSVTHFDIFAPIVIILGLVFGYFGFLA